MVYVVLYNLYLQEKQTALHEAAIQSHPSVVRLLLEHGAIVNKKSDVRTLYNHSHQAEFQIT